MSGTGSTRFIPANDAEYCVWAQNVYNYAAEHHDRWGIMTPTVEMQADINELRIQVDKCQLPTRSKIDTLEKNIARRKSEKGMRGYIQGMVIRNPNVSDDDRQKMGLRIYDIIPTPVPTPVGLVTAAVRYPNEGAIELRISHVEGSPFDKRANYGVKIRYSVQPVVSPPPTDFRQLFESVFTRRKRELFTFEKADTHKLVYFCLRYENSKGGAGQWGPIITAIIP